jgi:hypothetical protein
MTLRTIFPRLLLGLVIVAGALWLALYRVGLMLSSSRTQ